MKLVLLFLSILMGCALYPAVGHAQLDAPASASLHPTVKRPALQFAPQMNNSFALDLYAQVAEESPAQNLFFSPYSIVSALTMTAEGARGDTALQMGTVLRFPERPRRQLWWWEEHRQFPHSEQTDHFSFSFGISELEPCCSSDG